MLHSTAWAQWKKAFECVRPVHVPRFEFLESGHIAGSRGDGIARLDHGLEAQAVVAGQHFHRDRACGEKGAFLESAPLRPEAAIDKIAAMLTLTLKDAPAVPLEAECISPDVIAPLNSAEVAALPVWLGRRQLRLDDCFTVEGEPSDEIEVRGDTVKVKWIGKEMSRGRIRVQGNAGMHLGAYMAGGRIDVDGNGGDWVGGEMKGGTIHIRGNAGGQLGSAYRGGITGMDGGTILVEGTAGIELGMRMKRGLIAVRGVVRDFAGLQMKGGTIVLMDGAELRTGAWMFRGTIISLKPVKLLPTFAACGTHNPVFLNIYAKHLRTHGFDLPFATASGSYRRYAGDSSVPGKGELFVWQPVS